MSPSRTPAPIPFLVAASMILAGCNTTTSPKPPPPVGMRIAPDRPIAIVNQTRLDLNDIQASLLEAAGADIVRERALDRAIAREAARRDLDVDEAGIAMERTLLLETLSGDPDRAERLLAELRRGRGLGPVRFSALLRRNALLRILVAEDIVLAEDVVKGAWDKAHGARRVVRVIATRDLRSAEDARRRILAGEDFAVVAVESSMDSSALRGGRLAPISRLDPSWPAGFREAIFELEPGTLSPSIPVEGRMIVLEVLEEIPADGVTFEEGRDRAERAAKLAAERLVMDRLARRLVPEEGIEALDPSLRWSLQGDSTSQLRR